MPRLNYFLRCAPCWRFQNLLQTYDSTLLSILEKILNCSFTNWNQLSLPVRRGGFGLRNAVTSAIPFYLASFHSVLPVVETLIPEAVLQNDTSLSAAMQQFESQFGPSPVSRRDLQTTWETSFFDNMLQTLSDGATTPLAKARLLAVQQPESGLWLSAVPSEPLKTHIKDRHFHIISGLRLGAKIVRPHICCDCGTPVSSFGVHGLACRKSAGRLSRHSSINDLIARALRSAEIPTRLEPRGCSDDNKRPDGVTLIPFDRGLSLAFDATCVDTYAPSHLPGTSTTPGAAAKQAEADKRRKYADLADDFLFVPVAVETSGVWGQEALQLIQKIGSRIANITMDARATNFLMQRISIAIQHGNAASVLGSFQTGDELLELFLL